MTERAEAAENPGPEGPEEEKHERPPSGSPMPADPMEVRLPTRADQRPTIDRGAALRAWYLGGHITEEEYALIKTGELPYPEDIVNG